MRMRQILPAGAILLACLLQGCSPAIGADAGAVAAPPRGSSDAYQEDQKIETAALDRIYGQYNVLIHVNVTSLNRNVLVSGEVPDEATRAAIEKIVSGIGGVRKLYNELAVSGNSSLVARSNDSLITSSVKMRLARDRRVYSGDIKVVTENGTIFLMGNIGRTEAEAAAEIASATNRVKLVVKLFEYAD